jgi:uncharacterized protein Yka (UPF0111/DUF47 family)
MDTFDMIAEPILFAQQLHAHAQGVRRSVEVVRPLVEALLAQDHEKIKSLHEQVSRIREQVNQTRLSLYDHIKSMHFDSVGGYAFNQYLTCQDKTAAVAERFAALLVSSGAAVPRELHADFRAFAAQVAHVCTQAAILAENISLPPESLPPAVTARNTFDAIQGISADNRRARQLGMQLAQGVCRLQERLGPATLLFLDKYCTTLYEAADNAEDTANHLRLMVR